MGLGFGDNWTDPADDFHWERQEVRKMTEVEAAIAIIQTVSAARKVLGGEPTVGMLLGFIMGEVRLSGGKKEDIHKLIDTTWDAFVEAQEKAGG